MQLLKTRRGRAVLAVLLIAVSVAFALLILPQVNDLRTLRGAHASAVAEVTETRVSHGMHFDTSYDLLTRQFGGENDCSGAYEAGMICDDA